jgi:hypothetical protein
VEEMKKAIMILSMIWLFSFVVGAVLAFIGLVDLWDWMLTLTILIGIIFTSVTVSNICQN